MATQPRIFKPTQTGRHDDKMASFGPDIMDRFETDERIEPND
jgi:hypothetical protein